MVGREFVQEEDRRSLACLLEIETDIVAGDGIGHFDFPFLGPGLKIAVNARGCNEAKSISFSSRNDRGITPKPILRCRIASCSRHTATRIRTPDVGHHTPTGIGGVKEE
jgi:hypothetical protein